VSALRLFLLERDRVEWSERSEAEPTEAGWIGVRRTEPGVMGLLIVAGEPWPTRREAGETPNGLNNT
jgi:hypothetical protein